MTTRTDSGSHDERFTRNVYLAPQVAGLVEHQTAHGSADDIAGLGHVEEHAGCAGAGAAMRAAIEAARAAVGTTPDRGGTAGTEDVVAALRRGRLSRRSRAPRAAPARPGR